MVADDEIYAFLLRIDNFFGRFDTAVNSDYQAHTLASCEVDTLYRDTVTFGVAVGDVE